MMGKCTMIKKSDLKRGDWVFRVSKGRASHIGYIVDDALNVVEAKGRDEGVVKRHINANGSSYWNAYGRPEIFKAEIEAPKEVIIKRLLKLTFPRLQGDDVKELQHALRKAGFPKKNFWIVGSYDNNTVKAVKEFQKANRLKLTELSARIHVEN